MSRAYVEQALAEPELFRTMFQFSPDLALGGADRRRGPAGHRGVRARPGSVVEAIDSGALRPADPLTSP